MKYSFHPEAEVEFIQSIDYYEECKKGLGYEFALEVYLTIQRVVSYPKAWQILDGEIRRTLVNRFPYGILYSVEPNEIFIIAVMNLHRKPGYWKKRI